MNEETHPLTLRVLNEIARERVWKYATLGKPGEWQERRKAWHLLTEIGRLAEDITCGETLVNIRNGLVSIAATLVCWAEQITAELDKSTADRVATSAGTTGGAHV